MNDFALPVSLVTQLRAYERRLRRMETLAAVAGGVVGVLATFVLLFVCDRFVDTPRVARTFLALSGGVLAAWFVHAWAAHWLWHRRGPAQLAKLLQRHFKTLGDRLQGIIELSETDDLPPNISPALLRAAIHQVADESARFNFKSAVPVRPARSWVLAAGLLVALAAAPFVLVPKAAHNALARWMHPWSPIDRYTFASLEALPDELVVAHGEPFEIACGLKADSAWKPQIAVARMEHAEPQQAKFENYRAVFKLAGQTQNGTLSLRVGDATREIAIRPLHRPEMKELAAHVELPAYLGYPAATMPIQGGSAEFLEGSKVSFAGKTSRALKDAGMKAAREESAASIQEETFTTPAKPLADIGAETVFHWKDKHGLTPTQPYTLHVNTTHDAEPRVELQGLEQETAILPNEVLKLNVASSDDYGVKEAWVGWTVRGLEAKKNEKIDKGDGAHTPGGQMQKEITASLEFTPALYKIPEDSVVDIAAYALDYFPKRKPVESWKYTVYVLSPAKHAERVRQRMDEVLKQLDERIRDEERQIEETKAIADDKKSLAEEKAGEDIKHVEASERANEAALKTMTEEMHGIMRDAMRNQEIPEGTIADWQNIAEQLEQKADPPMQEAAQSLEQGAQQPGARESQLGQAQQQQQEALEAMRNAAKKMNTTNESLYARNFYNRMRAAASTEHKISDGLKGLARETAGLKTDEIAPSKIKGFAEAADKQVANTKDVDGIGNDMAAFVKRVANEKYEAVEKEMVEKRVVAELTDLAGFVRQNLGLKSVGRARQWGDQLDEWASMLQSECNSQGGGEIDPDVMEFMVSMVRAAVVQDGIREQTQLVDQGKDANTRYADDAQKLGDQQEELSGTLGGLLQKILFDGVQKSLTDPLAATAAPAPSKFAKFQPAIEAALKMSGDVSGELHKPQTDNEVLGTEAAIIEVLVPPDKKGGKSKAQQMMRQMMAQATQARKPSGNNSKSSSSFAGDTASGAVSKDTNGTRRVEKTGGASSAGEWPEEFRDQLQAYFQQLENGGGK